MSGERVRQFTANPRQSDPGRGRVLRGARTRDQAAPDDQGRGGTVARNRRTGSTPPADRTEGALSTPDDNEPIDPLRVASRGFGEVQAYADPAAPEPAPTEATAPDPLALLSRAIDDQAAHVP